MSKEEQMAYADYMVVPYIGVVDFGDHHVLHGLGSFLGAEVVRRLERPDGDE
jgi:hypothetical protein